MVEVKNLRLCNLFECQSTLDEIMLIVQTIDLTFAQINLQLLMPLISAFLWASETAEAFISIPTTWNIIRVQKQLINQGSHNQSTYKWIAWEMAFWILPYQHDVLKSVQLFQFHSKYQIAKCQGPTQPNPQQVNTASQQQVYSPEAKRFTAWTKKTLTVFSGRLMVILGKRRLEICRT